MQAAAEVLGDLGHGQAVEVAQGERGPVVGPEPVQHGPGADDVEVLVPGVDDLGCVLAHLPEVAFLDSLPAPVVDQPAAGDHDQPPDADAGDGPGLDRPHRVDERRR